MFNTISWQSYWIAIAAGTAVYYLFVYLFYFKGSVGIISLKDHSQGPNTPALSQTKEPEMQPSLFDRGYSDHRSSIEENEDHIIEACMDELNAFFDNQRKSKAVKSELMYALYTILQKYPSLRNSDYKESLSNVISTQCENICSIHLSAEELKGVWLG
jgi:hypothetical protein